MEGLKGGAGQGGEDGGNDRGMRGSSCHLCRGDKRGNKVLRDGYKVGWGFSCLMAGGRTWRRRGRKRGGD